MVYNELVKANLIACIERMLGTCMMVVNGEASFSTKENAIEGGILAGNDVMDLLTTLTLIRGTPASLIRTPRAEASRDPRWEAAEDLVRAAEAERRKDTGTTLN